MTDTTPTAAPQEVVEDTTNNAATVSQEAISEALQTYLAAQSTGSAQTADAPGTDDTQTETAEDPKEDQVENDDSDDPSEEDFEADSSDDLKAVLRKNRKVNRENQKLRERAIAAETKLLQFEVAAESGLPSSIAHLLQGTRDEMTASAETLKELIGAAKTAPKLDPIPKDHVERTQSTLAERSLDEIAASLRSRR